MYMSREFRTVLLGGYNREEVDEYVHTMEKNVEAVKLGYQNEIAKLKADLQKVQEEKEVLEGLVQEEYESKPESTENQKKEAGIEVESCIEELKSQKKENEDLRQQIAALEAEKFLLSEKTKRIEQELEELKESNITIEKNSQLEDEIRQLKEKKEKYEENFEVITKVLEDARRSARHIQDEAQKNAEEILARARTESKNLLEYRKLQVDKELEDKGIRLMAAKYKIEAYRKEINSTQQKLYNLYTEMGKMAEGIPQRLEQLWEEDESLPIDETETDSKEKNSGELYTDNEKR